MLLSELGIVLKMLVNLIVFFLVLLLLLKMAKDLAYMNGGSKKLYYSFKTQKTDNILLKNYRKQNHYINQQMGKLGTIIRNMRVFGFIYFLIVIGIWSLLPFRAYMILLISLLDIAVVYVLLKGYAEKKRN